MHDETYKFEKLIIDTNLHRIFISSCLTVTLLGMDSVERFDKGIVEDLDVILRRIIVIEAFDGNMGFQFSGLRDSTVESSGEGEGGSGDDGKEDLHGR